jgi:SLT domain-containing protein
VAVQSASEDVHAIFECIIAHESGGDPAAVNPSSGAGGLFQFLPSSWLAYGGGQFAPLPNLATADQQWQIALAAQAQSYWYPWVGTNCTPVG